MNQEPEKRQGAEGKHPATKGRTSLNAGMGHVQSTCMRHNKNQAWESNSPLGILSYIIYY